MTRKPLTNRQPAAAFRWWMTLHEAIPLQESEVREYLEWYADPQNRAAYKYILDLRMSRELEGAATGTGVPCSGMNPGSLN